jgi:DNA primase
LRHLLVILLEVKLMGSHPMIAANDFDPFCAVPPGKSRRPRHGVEYAVASLGTACTPEHIRKLLKLADEVVFGFDGDKAGRRAAWRALENSMPEVRDGKELRFLFLPAEHDPDSYVQEFGKAQFEQLIAQDALPLSQYLLKELSAQVDLTMEDGRARLLRITQPDLEQLTLAPILKLMLSKRLAELCQLTMDELSQLMVGVSAPKQVGSYSAEQYAGDVSADFGMESRPAEGEYARPKRQFQQKQWQPKSSFSGGQGKRWNKDEPQRVPLPPRPQQNPLLRVLQLIVFKPALLQGCEVIEEQWPQQGFVGAVRSVLQYVRQSPDVTPNALLTHWQGEPLYARLLQIQSESQGIFDRFDDTELQEELQATLQTAAQSQERSSTLDRKTQLEYRANNGGLTDSENEEYLALLLRK